MKKISFILLAILWIGCDDNGDSANSNPLIPGRKVYIAGSDADGAWYILPAVMPMVLATG